MKHKPTSFDIAHLAGVSQSTVSRALNDSPLVNIATRQKVQEIARELNYQVDKNASNLRRQRSSTIALLLFEDPTSDDSLVNPFFLAMLGSITKACAAKGYDLLVSFQNLESNWQAEYEDSHKADGLILLGYGDYRSYAGKLSQLHQHNTHVMRWGAPVEQWPGISIGCDNFSGGQSVTRHLLSHDYQSFAFIGDIGDKAPEFQSRYEGFLSALDKQHNHQQYDAISSEEAGIEAAKYLLATTSALPDAIVCAADIIAVGVLQQLKEAGIRVPEDVAVVGFDNIQLAAFTTPGLTTVQQNTAQAGEKLVENLLLAIDGQPTDDHLLPTNLVVRQSCGCDIK
ncbi:MAG: LacI family DNA-binding transcriptional regulator [Pseudomonadota bacterium]|jgi:DNA-binding LacI/PurR family transcriptional regulator|uniref:LacI family transcriptional regulator n=1 Tax=Alteromonas alba TaxID=2079529 RepID=A0A2S9VCC3_9ALTE|nr:LacI family DNA-binding transcriptional regulator [Alteromonas alba]MCP4863747.1 LacI family transcriptional regulator [Alteromonas sp.]MDY6927622.1 LacI family DNA-binding transcriptional regulator [Pseudomonadota bacterium]PRO74108.1 LacI family transcriptional regulator [Alteromonas alba]|tara:strand:+ start:6346 stop:7368 length:1023 start_codon:yes stop_codon:yes gene_type:complete